MPRDPEQFRGNLLGREHEVNGAGRNSGLGHAGKLGRFVLGERNSALALDDLDSGCSVARGPREHNPDGPFPGFLGKRHQEVVDRISPRTNQSRFDGVQYAIREGERRVGGNDIDMVGFNASPLGHLPDGHLAEALQDGGHHALMGGGKMRDQDEGNSGIGREVLEQFLKGLEASRRGPDPGDGESFPRTAGRGFPLLFRRRVLRLRIHAFSLGTRGSIRSGED